MREILEKGKVRGGGGEKERDSGEGTGDTEGAEEKKDVRGGGSQHTDEVAGGAEGAEEAGEAEGAWRTEAALRCLSRQPGDDLTSRMSAILASVRFQLSSTLRRLTGSFRRPLQSETEPG